jgi:GntR family transcriptional regulator
MATPSKRQPKYLRIAADLRRYIADGSYTPGSRLPGENEIMASYHVARETARKALAQLINEGIATPKRGAGVFVRGFRPIIRSGIQRLANTTWPVGKSIWGAEAEGRTLAVDSVQVQEEDTPSHAAVLLGLGEDERVFVRRRRYVLDGKPVLLARSYLPAKLVADSAITQPDTGPGGIYARLRELGHSPTHFREDLRARMPEPGETDELVIAAGTPVVEIVRTAYTENGLAVEVNEMVADASAYVFRYDFTTTL